MVKKVVAFFRYISKPIFTAFVFLRQVAILCGVDLLRSQWRNTISKERLVLLGQKYMQIHAN